MLLLLFIEGGLHILCFNGPLGRLLVVVERNGGREIEYCRWNRNHSVAPLFHSASLCMYSIFEQREHRAF
jgi:hypothetical protein